MDTIRKGKFMKKENASTQLDDLIRGELSAVECYDVALPKITDLTERDTLRQFKQDHVRAIEVLKKYAPTEVIMESQTSGVWGKLTKAFTSGASIFGDKAALKALKAGEAHGVKEYKEALADAAIQSELKQLIRTELLPNQEKHIQALDSFS